MVAVRCEEFHAKRVDRSKKRATERFHGFERKAGFENSLPCTLLHFVSGSVRVSDNHKLWQPFKGALSILRHLNDAVGNRARFTGAGGSDHRKIAIQIARKSLSRGFVGNRRHFASSSSLTVKARCVSAHFS